MANNSFTLNPHQSAIISIDFGNRRLEVDIDLLITGSYQPTVDGRIAKRLHYWNSFYGPDSPYTLVNNSNGIVSYDITGCYKEQSDGDHPFYDADGYELNPINVGGVLKGYNILPYTRGGILTSVMHMVQGITVMFS